VSPPRRELGAKRGAEGLKRRDRTHFRLQIHSKAPLVRVQRVSRPGYASEEERRHFQAGLPVKSSLAVPRRVSSRRTAARTRQAPTPPSPYSVERGDGGGEALPPKARLFCTRVSACVAMRFTSKRLLAACEQAAQDEEMAGLGLTSSHLRLRAVHPALREEVCLPSFSLSSINTSSAQDPTPKNKCRNGGNPTTSEPWSSMMKTPPLKLIPEGGGFQCTATHRNNKATRLLTRPGCTSVSPAKGSSRRAVKPPSVASDLDASPPRYRRPNTQRPRLGRLARWVRAAGVRQRDWTRSLPSSTALVGGEQRNWPREPDIQRHSEFSPQAQPSVTPEIKLVSPPVQPGLDSTIYMSQSTGSWTLSKPLAHSPATLTPTAWAREPDRHGDLLGWRSTLCRSCERKLCGGVACTREVGWVRQDRDLTPNPMADQLNMSRALGLESLASRLRTSAGIGRGVVVVVAGGSGVGGGSAWTGLELRMIHLPLVLLRVDEQWIVGVNEGRQRLEGRLGRVDLHASDTH
jgi:hypothetical protein